MTSAYKPYDASHSGAPMQQNGIITASSPTTDNAALALFAQGSAENKLSVPLPFSSPITIIERTPVVGTLNDRCTASVNYCIEPGCELILKCQQGNLQDRWAVEVLLQGERLGWVSADHNEVVFRLLEGGKTLSATIVDSEYAPHGVRYLMDITLDD